MVNPFSREFDFDRLTKMWPDVEPFEASLKYIGTYRGRSSIIMHMEHVVSGDVYNMFFSVFNGCVLGDKRVSVMYEGGLIFTGTWVIHKQGTGYSIVPVGNEATS